MDGSLLSIHHLVRNENDERAKKRKIVVGYHIVISTAIAVWWHKTHLVKEPSQDLRSARELYLRRLYYGSDRACREQLRLSQHAFNSLCNKLREKGGLRETVHVRIEKAVAMFLYMLGHNLKNRVVKFHFIRSGETASRHFNAVLRAVIKLGKEYLVQPEKEIEGYEDEKWEWFEDCLGALDGTYVPVTVPSQDEGSYRNRKGFNATNILGVCSRDLKFVYILPGWEGSAVDGRVLRDALARPNPLIVPNGMDQLGEGSKKGKGYFSWTPAMDQTLCTCFIDQINQGNRLDGKFVWKAVAWTNAINALRDEHHVSVAKQNIQSRLKTWEKHYDVISQMLSTSGFSWNYDKGRVDVEERVWNAYVQAHPKAIPYRRKITIENWDSLSAIFAQDRANGEGAQTALEDEMEMTTNEESNNLQETFGTNERGLENDATQTSGGRNELEKSNASSSSIPRTEKRKHSGSEALSNVLGRMADSLDRYLNSDPSKATTQMVLEEVSKVQDLDETQVLKAVDLLMNDQRKFDTFSGLPNDLKRRWILMHLGG